MKKLLLAFLLVFTFFACNKDGTTTPSTITLSNSTIAGDYKTTGATITPIGSTLVFDFYSNDSYFPACERDNLHTFTVGGMYTYADIGVFCSTPPAAPQTGPYSISGTDQLTFSGKTYTVETFTSTKMTIAYDSSSVGRVHLVLSRQ